MSATIIMGGQWGDEGKGKLTDALAARAQVVVRANGGSNAGHTVSTSAGIFKLHLMPSGILNPDCDCVIGAGVVIDPAGLLGEIEALEARGISTARLWISERAHVVLPYHPGIDRSQETSRGDGSIGTTLRGNGPAYADKVSRHGIRVADLVDRATLDRRLRVELDLKNKLITEVYGGEPLDADAMVETFAALGERLRPHMRATEVLVQDALDAGSQVLVECAQGAMLDIDYGTYPFVTSSSPTAAGACQGAGIAPRHVERVVAVFKAYSTRVGAGPFPTELDDATGDLIRERGREYGTTTGRPRRTGWFDGVAARYVARLNGVTEVALTLLDVLDVFESIAVCTHYRIDGERIDHVPAREDHLREARPVHAALPGWRTDLSGARAAEELPDEAMAYVSFLEDRMGAPISMVGVGPDRDQLIPMRPSAAMLVPAPAG